MTDTNEMLDMVTPKKELTEKERFKILQSKPIDKNVKEYLMDKLDNLYIEVLSKYEGSLFELMSEDNLEGWCWETTESAIVFFNDDDYISRGYLRFDGKTPNYYHSWMCFKFEDTEYVLDPCLNILCKNSDYSEIFETVVISRVTAKETRKDLIKHLTAPKEEMSESAKEFHSFLKELVGDYLERKSGEVTLPYSNNKSDPLYRNGAGYKAKIDNGKVKKLTVHYYDDVGF